MKKPEEYLLNNAKYNIFMPQNYVIQHISINFASSFSWY